MVKVTSTRTKYGGPFGVTYEGTTNTSSKYSNSYLSINAYGNLEFKWIGFGLGPLVIIFSSIFPSIVFFSKCIPENWGRKL